MAGFFSSAGIRGFVTGFANQANENIERQKLEDRENDLIWANKFEKGKAEYEKERKDTSEKTQFYNTLLKTFGNNSEAADLAFQVAKANPKGAQQAISWVYENYKGGAFANGSESTTLSDMQNNLATRYSNLEELKGSARQGSLLRSGNSYADKMQMPMAPNGYNGSQPASQVSSPMPSSLPAPNPNSFQPPTPSSSSAPISVSKPSAIQPGSQLDTDIGSASPSGAPISLDAPATGEPTINTQDTVLPPRGPTAAPMPAQAVPSSSPSTPTVPQADPKTPEINPATGRRFLTPYLSPETQRQANQTDIARQHLELEMKKFEYQKSTKPESYQQQQNILLGNKLFEKYMDDPKFGVNVRYQQTVDSQALRYDVNSMAQQLQQGLMAGYGQPGLDAINRFTSRFLGLDLGQAGIGIANDPSEVQLMKKNIANTMIDRLKTLHFGRITNYTEKIVQQGLPSTDNDPDTNIKIVLALKDHIASAVKMATIEKQILDDPANLAAIQAGAKNYPQLMIEAKNAASKYADAYMKQDAPFPTLKSSAQVTQLEPGTWFEREQDHRMYRFMGVDNGTMVLQNAGSRTGGMPQTIKIPMGQQ